MSIRNNCRFLKFFKKPLDPEYLSDMNGTPSINIRTWGNKNSFRIEVFMQDESPLYRPYYQYDSEYEISPRL